MALYFAAVNVTTNSPVPNLYDVLVAHYAQVPASSFIPALLPPVPHTAAWLRLNSAATGTGIYGTSSSSPFYALVQALPVEFPNFGRNVIDLRNIWLELPSGGALLDVTFAVI